MRSSVVLAAVVLSLVANGSDCQSPKTENVPAYYWDFEEAFRAGRSHVPWEQSFELVGYDDNGITFRSDVGPEVRQAYERMVSQARSEQVLRFFQDPTDPAYSHGFDPDCRWRQVPLVMLCALFRVSPQDGRNIAAAILFNARPIVGVPFSFSREARPNRWPTLHRACFYFLLKAHGAEAEKQFVANVTKFCSCPFTVIDALLLEKAGPLEKDYFRKHGEWPDPDVVPGCTLLSEVKQVAGRARVSEGSSSFRMNEEDLFPDLPVFWCLKTWEDECMISSLVRLIADVEKDVPAVIPFRISWPEYGYRCLRIHHRVDDFRELAKSQCVTAQILGCAGVIDCLAQEGRFDREFTEEALIRVLGEKEDRRQIILPNEEGDVGDVILDYLGYMWSEYFWRRYLEAHVEEWMALCGGKSKPPRVLLRVAQLAAEARLYTHPVESMPGVDGAILTQIDQAIKGDGWKIETSPGGYYGASRYVEVLAATRTDKAFAWLKAKFGSLSPSLRVTAIHACRHFGRERLAELTKDTTGWSDPEKKALVEISRAVDCMEKAQGILAQYREKRLSLNEALLGVARLRHEVVLPWIWELARGRGGEISSETRRKIEEELDASTRRQDYFAENVVLIRLLDEFIPEGR